MTVPEFLEQFRLHDSGFDSIIFRPADHQLFIALDLCNFEQPNYHKGAPEILRGWLQFEGVSLFESEPSISVFRWGSGIDGEIISLALEIPPDESGKSKLRIVGQVMDYAKKKKEVLVMSFYTSRVQWQLRGDVSPSTH